MSDLDSVALSQVVVSTLERTRRVRPTGLRTPSGNFGLGSGGLPRAVRRDFAILVTAANWRELPSHETPFGPLPPLPPALFAVHQIRADLGRAFDLTTRAGYAQLWLWAISDGRRDDEDLADAIEDARKTLLEPVSINGDPSSICCPWLAGLLWCGRLDLQAGFRMTAAQNLVELSMWFLRRGIFDLRCGDLVSDDHVALLASVDRDTSKLPLTRYIEFIHEARADLAAVFDASSFAGRFGLLRWFFEYGINEYPTHSEVLKRQLSALDEWRMGQAGNLPPH